MVTIPELRSIDCIFWSPAGRYCVLAQLYNLQQVCILVHTEIFILMVSFSETIRFQLWFSYVLGYRGQLQQCC